MPLHKKNKFTPRILHYETYALMLAAAENCQLCALVIKNFKSTRDWRPGQNTPIYRRVKREQDEAKKDLFPEQARHLTVMNFEGEYQGYDLDFGGVELYVQEGKL